MEFLDTFFQDDTDTDGFNPFCKSLLGPACPVSCNNNNSELANEITYQVCVDSRHLQVKTSNRDSDSASHTSSNACDELKEISNASGPVAATEDSEHPLSELLNSYCEDLPPTLRGEGLSGVESSGSTNGLFSIVENPPPSQTHCTVSSSLAHQDPTLNRRCKTPGLSSYLDQLDSCFDSQLSPAPAPAPGQNNNAGQVGNKEAESAPVHGGVDVLSQAESVLFSPSSRENTLEKSMAIPDILSTELQSKSTVSCCNEEDTAKKSDKSGFKTDLSKFFSRTPRVVSPAVQSGQNVIPLPSQHDRGFWNNDKHDDWEEDMEMESITRKRAMKMNRVEETVLRSQNYSLSKFPPQDLVLKSVPGAGVLKNIRVSSPMVPYGGDQKQSKLNLCIKIEVNKKRRVKPQKKSLKVNRNIVAIVGGAKDSDGKFNVKSSGKIKVERVGAYSGAEGTSTLACPVCWRCKSRQSPGPWHAHKWQQDRYLCTSCFSFFKRRNAQKREQMTREKKEINDDETSASTAGRDPLDVTPGP